MKHLSSLTDLIDQADAFFLDMYGTIWNGTGFYESVPELFLTLKQAGKKIYILSNATALSSVLIQQAAQKGLVKGIHFDDFISSGDVFHAHLRTGFFERVTQKSDYRFYVLGRPNTALFKSCLMHQTTAIPRADILYISGLETTNGLPLSLEPFLKEAREALTQEIPAVCANPDYMALHGDTAYVTGGALGKWYEEAGGRVYWFGKPYPVLFDYAFQKTRAIPARSVMVGDTLRTDIKGGREAGMQTVLITAIGVTAYEAARGVSMERQKAMVGVEPDYDLPMIK